jgi:hypothetical protein
VRMRFFWLLMFATEGPSVVVGKLAYASSNGPTCPTLALRLLCATAKIGADP